MSSFIDEAGIERIEDDLVLLKDHVIQKKKKAKKGRKAGKVKASQSKKEQGVAISLLKKHDRQYFNISIIFLFWS